MKIFATQYNLNDYALEIYLSGCTFHCKNCHNPELWDFNVGSDFTSEHINQIVDKIKDSNGLIKKIWILGGEPLQQKHEELFSFLKILKEKTDTEIWLWTGYDLEEVPESILNQVDYIKSGLYIEELRTEDNIQYGVKLASSNQYIKRISVD